MIAKLGEGGSQGPSVDYEGENSDGEFPVEPDYTPLDKKIEKVRDFDECSEAAAFADSIVAASKNVKRAPAVRVGATGKQQPQTVVAPSRKSTPSPQRASTSRAVNNTDGLKQMRAQRNAALASIAKSLRALRAEQNRLIAESSKKSDTNLTSTSRISRLTLIEEQLRELISMTTSIEPSRS